MRITRNSSILPLALLACSVTAGNGQTTSQTIIIDHTATDLSKIPDYWIEQARKLTMFYSFTSHGTQIVSGLETLQRMDPKYNAAVLRGSSTFRLPDAAGALRILGGTPEDYVTPDLFWSEQGGRDNTMAAAATGLFQLAGWAWCGQQSENDTATVQQYLNTLNAFEAANPKMRFILFTGHTDGGSDTLARNNEMVRAWARQNGKVVFDFADIESWDPAGNHYPDTADDCAWCSNWCDAHPSDCRIVPDDCAHSHPFNCVLKARAFWWMMARLAGWAGPDATSTTKPAFTQGAVVNAASFAASGAVAPREIVSIYGTGMGPQAGVGMALSSDGMTCLSSLGGTRVLFDGVAAPLLYASSTQVNAIVPASVAGRTTTQVQVEYNGTLSNSVALNVTEYAPGIFTLTAAGQAAALHVADYSVNGSGNAAARGSTIVVYGTAGVKGFGAASDGRVATAAQSLDAQVTAQIGGVTAPVVYAGAAPALVNGVVQFNITVPANAQTGNAVPLYVWVNGVRSQSGVTVAVR